MRLQKKQPELKRMLLNSPDRGLILPRKPEIGSALVVGKSVFIVASTRYISEDLAEDFDWFDVAMAGGGWEVGLRQPESAEDLEKVKVESDRLAGARSRRAQKLLKERAEKRENNRRLAAEASALETAKRQLEGLASTDFVNYEDVKGNRILCTKSECPSPSTCYHVGRTWMQQQGWTEVIATSGDIGPFGGYTLILKHPTDQLFCWLFGNRCEFFAPQERVDRWLAVAADDRKLTVEKAEKWLEKYRGCVGTELYEWRVKNAPES